MKLELSELICISDALADKIDYMVQNGDGTDPQTNLVYVMLKDVFKKVNDEYKEIAKNNPDVGAN